MTTTPPTPPLDAANLARIDRLAEALAGADAVLVGAGAGLSVADGDAHAGPAFEARFADFHAARGITDAYSGGFYPFPTPEEKWAFWARNILLQRYESGPGAVYRDLYALLDGRDFFVLTTNVDHRFQNSGFPKDRLFYTQGDYGLFQCSVPCSQDTHDNHDAVVAMDAAERAGAAAGTPMRVPTRLLPTCPRCGEPLTTNLRSDDTFVQDAGWYAAAERYVAWADTHQAGRVLHLELGVGMNTPGIIKYPFWRRVHENPEATYAALSLEPGTPREIADRSILIDADLGAALAALRERLIV
ncbi:Sir2 silent information regulator family NAD-dependent deacetylase [Actinomyces sp. Z5]|uniref:SIR2 family NAD-dependent protein deacylase n=1 Tax=Actinomyces sp. Z5 TaxID=2250216 RepID=UPI00215BF65B|nr:Sir2 silent information regulator family NAD-dependent deacetylase [Actinomyces sp. Z5]